MIYEKKEMLLNNENNTEKTFDKMIKKAKEIKNKSNDLTINKENIKNIRLIEGNLLFKSDQFEEYISANLSSTAFSQLCSRIGVPVKYMNSCLFNKMTNLVENNINEWLKLQVDNQNDILARLYNGYNIRGLLTTSYSIFDSDEILDVVSDCIDYNQYKIEGFLLNEERLHIRLISREPITAIKGKDFDKDLFSGIVIDSSDVGRKTLSVKYFIYKKVCTNGLIVTKSNNNLLNQIHRGIEKDNFRKAFQNSLLQVDGITENVISMIEKANKNEIPYFEEMKSYNKYIEKIKEKTKIPKSIIDKAIDIMDEKYNHTTWGLINGITELAQEKSFERRIELEELASNLLTAKI